MKMRKSLSMFVCLLMVVTVFAVAVPINVVAQDELIEEWVAIYNNDLVNGDDDATRSVIDSSGNVYVSGRSWGGDPSQGGTDFDYATVKYDPNGNELWVARYNGPGNGLDFVRDITVDSDGNVYIAGSSNGFYQDYATIKYNSNGVEQWVARYDYYNDNPYAITVDSSGYVYVTGISDNPSVTRGDYLTIKYDRNGKELWVARYDGPAHVWDYAEDIALDTSGNVYITGIIDHTPSGGDYGTIKYDSNGNFQWFRRYHGPTTYRDYGIYIDLDSAANVYVSGFSYGTGTNADVATIKYDTNGNELWVARYNGPANGFDRARAMAVDSSGNVYITGHSYGLGTNDDYLTIKYDSAGTELWTRKYDGPGNGNDHGMALTFDASGNIYVTGDSYGDTTGVDFATVVYDSSGNELSVLRYNGLGNSGDFAEDVSVDNAGNVYVTGVSIGIGTCYDFAVVKYSSNTPPTITSITGPIDPIPVDNNFLITGTFEDLDSEDTHTALWDWGDDSTSAGTVDEIEGTVSGSHQYTTPGVYIITLTVEDAAGKSDTEIFEQYVVAYDPHGGFVTGGGWIDSPEGAYVPDPTLMGKASFGFVSKYLPGAAAPTGNTEFQFKVADLNFHSSNYEWLVVAGATAKFKGTGTINNEGEYKFKIWATDGDLLQMGGFDKFRIKIWEKDEFGNEYVIYDNKEETDLGGGQIVIHKA
jgi:PKD repeat protein